ncbi:MAG TPA: 4-hydroxybenzoate octaprenyltransferase [Rhodocyclaceae bacterium]|nr:4-hydroxybenzoate octaprenyltransferase [Rhodocyclaceae bacterium]
MTLKQLAQRIDAYERLMRLDKPIGILLLLWPTLSALWIASGGHPDAWIVWIFVLGTVLMRSAGCVINDYADRKIDPHIERTRKRPLAAQEIGAGEALALAAALSLCAFILILPLPKKVWGLSLIALFLTASYPYTKRFLAIPQAYLGIAFGFGIPMAFSATLENIPHIAGWMMLANVFWALAYDTEYAMVDREDDLKIGVRSSAIAFGRFDVAAVMLCYLGMLCAHAYVGWTLHFGPTYYLGLLLAAAVAVYHYGLIRQRTREGCFKAFRHNNWIGAAVFAGIVGHYNLPGVWTRWSDWAAYIAGVFRH